MSFESHAEFELMLAGLFDKDSDYGGMLGPSVIELIKLFASQGHSGQSATLVLSLFTLLADFKPITALRGTDDEWNEVSNGVFQNRRCGRIFKENGVAYDIDGRVFREKNGVCFTSQDSRVPVTFPYIPKTEYVDITESEPTSPGPISPEPKDFSRAEAEALDPDRGKNA